MKYFLSGILLLLVVCNHHDLLADEIPIDDQILHFDDVEGNFQNLNFKDEKKIKPGPGIFEIIETHFMSNGLGERWAVVTIRNTSAGKRLLKNENIMVTFADGSQSFAQNLDDTLDGNDTLTKAVLFGIHKFPILNIEAR